ncbi:MAG: hypothetical protein M9894_28960 [Planctomycetes bacterium]|nr:hypothetical protein [Planctomycetota bacterium]
MRGHEPLIQAMANDEADRHVAAAAIKAGAQVIVTLNLRDFAGLPPGLEVQPPDEFLGNLLDLDPEGMVALLTEQAAALRNPPRTLDEILGALGKLAPDFAADVRQLLREQPGAGSG